MPETPTIKQAKTSIAQWKGTIAFRKVQPGAGFEKFRNKASRKRAIRGKIGDQQEELT